MLKNEEKNEKFLEEMNFFKSLIWLNEFRSSSFHEYHNARINSFINFYDLKFFRFFLFVCGGKTENYRVLLLNFLDQMRGFFDESLGGCSFWVTKFFN